MLKILQARLQQYVNHELPDVQAYLMYLNWTELMLILKNTHLDKYTSLL